MFVPTENRESGKEAGAPEVVAAIGRIINTQLYELIHKPSEMDKSSRYSPTKTLIIKTLTYARTATNPPASGELPSP